MIDSKPDGSDVEAPRGKSRWMQGGILGAACVVVVAAYGYMAHSGFLVSSSLNAADSYYNLLVQGFRAGQLSLKKEVPAALAQLADPYEPAAHAPYPLLDMSYYKGNLYLYFGVTPALVLFWPYVALTGHYLLQKDAAVISCLVGFLVSVGLLCAFWRRYFAEVSVAVVAACALALGLASGVPILLSEVDVYEVPVCCGYMLTMLALGAVWCALHESERRWRWLAVASTVYGLALGARPNLLLGAVILLVPVAQAWRERRRMLPLLMAATVPILLIGLGLMLYNARRFDNPFEFGMRYQLAGQRQLSERFFSLHYLWFNIRVYFLEPARWSARSPFMHGSAVPPVPMGYTQVRRPFGVLTNTPLVWLALAVPLAWRSRSGPAGEALRWFVTAAALLFGICALTVGFFNGASFRYEVDFLPALVLLAVIGILGLERVLDPISESGLSDRPVWRRMMRSGWGPLLGVSVAFNLLASVEQCAEAHYNLGVALRGAGQMQEAMGQYEQALRIKPDFAEAHYGFGNALAQLGRLQEAIGHYEQALRIKADFADARNNLGNALLQLGQVQEAIGQFEQALRIKPDYVEAHYNLGNALLHAGQVQEAIRHYEQALQIRPDYAKAQYNLGLALEKMGRATEAIAHYQQALKFRPNFTAASDALARLEARQ